MTGNMPRYEKRYHLRALTIFKTFVLFLEQEQTSTLRFLYLLNN